MSEGTKIGEYKDNQEFKSAIKVEEAPEDMTATKMGDVSEFEKGLKEEPAAEAVSEETEAPAEEAAVEETPAPVAQEAPAPAAEEPAAEPNFLDFEQEMERQLLDYQEGDTVKGIVRSIEKSGVLVDISYKSDGFISNSEFSNDHSVNPADVVNIGDEILVTIVKIESKEGYTLLSRRKAEMEEIWNAIADSSKDKEVVKVFVASKVQGGLVAAYKGIKGFIPASQVYKQQNSELDEFVGQTLEVVILQSDRRRRKIIFSHKQAKMKAQKESAMDALETLEVGEVKPGRVTSIKDFGVFVDIGGIEGLVHISELSWSRVKHPSDLVAVGDDVKVFVLGVDKVNSKISLGMKQLKPDPWVEIAERFQVGQVVTGTITRVATFGAFIQIEENLEGLIHISELSYEHVKQVEDVVNSDDIVKARIIKLIPEEQKIGLSLKGVDEESDDSEEDSQEEH